MLGKELERQFRECELIRPFRRRAHDPGDRLEYAITGVLPANTGRMVTRVERFVGGGFAGQVYRVELAELHAPDGPITGLTVGRHYAIKILTPPSAFGRMFRDLLYSLAYQGRFSPQVNPAGVRVGVLWQKLIRRAARLRFGDDSAVCDTYATFYDPDLHSFGEINEWIDGRIWKFEVDDQLFGRWDFQGQPPDDHNAAEYVHKKTFMRDLVGLLHEMGAPELARQYEWWTCKSQPNVLKRLDAGPSPRAGLTAVDFRAGLALLPFAPMSPADLRLIVQGLVRGRFVQFDRSDLRRFRRFIEAHREDFQDLQPVIDELLEKEPVYRASLPDVTRHHVRLITSAALRKSVKEGTITAWMNLGRVDHDHAARLSKARVLFPLLFLIALVPVIGRIVVKLWGHAQTRAHAKRCVTSLRYLWRTLRGARIETLVVWHRQQRACDDRIRKLVDRPVRYWIQRILFGLLPAKWHRFLTELAYAKARIREAFGFAYMFVRVPSFREEWLLEQVEMGREEGMLTTAEAEKIAGQIKDPFIQKYLRCVAVHICTLPVTQIVSLAVALYVMATFGKSWKESLAYALGVLAFFQVTPISPGSMVRGGFVVYLMIAERNVRNYYVAALVSFWKYIGYLGFPIQMVHRYPALARLMAGRWAKGLTHVVPVFGESGALLEHFVFDMCFNLPLTIQRGFKARPVRWIVGTVIAAAVVAIIAYLAWLEISGWIR